VDLAEAPVTMSPSGASEIRNLPDFASGSFAHATVHAGDIADPAVLSEITEFYYVLEGRGELWRRLADLEEVIELVPGRCATIPPGVSFQYRTAGDDLYFIVGAAPRWERQFWHPSDLVRWPERSDPATGAEGRGALPWQTLDLPWRADYLAPDGSEIRLLESVPAGGVAHCALPAGATSRAVRHGTVEEIWFVIAGVGEMWREGQEEAVHLHAGRCVTIPIGVAFQFRSTGLQTLEILIGTFPQWPGADEAQPAAGLWG
jgi:mannose-6-phosphate isomerase-like protein (cupin superfamily)